MRFVEEFPKSYPGKFTCRAVQATHTGEGLGDTSSIENPDSLDAIEDAQ